MSTRHSASYAFAFSYGLLLSVLFSSCESKPEISNTSDTLNIGTVISAVECKTLIPSIPLSDLYITDDFFKSHKKKNIIFEYTISDTTVKLRGWELKKGIFNGSGNFDEPDSFTMACEGISSVSIGPNTSFGSQVTLGDSVSKIVNIIKADANRRKAILHFKPIKNALTHEITYKITIEFIGPGIRQFAEEFLFTNPSPPHQAFD